MTIKEIQNRIEAANANDCALVWENLPRVLYKDLPYKMKQYVDNKYTVSTGCVYLRECCKVEELNEILNGVSIEKAVKKALHAAVYLVESTNTQLPQPTGNEKIDAQRLESFSPVSLIASDFLQAVEEVTHTTIKKSCNNLFNQDIVYMLNAKLSTELTSINRQTVLDAADKMTGECIIHTRDGGKFTIKDARKLQGALSISANKILDTALMYLADVNYYASDKVVTNVNTVVEIPLFEYGKANGITLQAEPTDDPEKQKKENARIKERLKDFRKSIRNDLTDISLLRWSQEVKVGKNKGDYSERNIIIAHGINDGIIQIEFDKEIAKYFVNSYLMKYPTVLLKLDNRSPSAYAVGRKIAEHNCNRNNEERGSNNTLSVSSLLAVVPNIPTEESLKKKNQRNWKRLIKRPLEAALNSNIEVGYIKKWEYRNKSGDVLDADAADTLTFEQYKLLLVDFAIA